MSASASWSRVVRSVLYFVISDLVLLWYASDDLFCGHSRFAVAAKLALGTALWELCCSSGAEGAMRLGCVTPRLAPLLAAFVTGTGIASIPLWIYRGYGVFRFEGTVGDVSCVFTEGFGVAFPFVVAPALAFVSLILGWLALRYKRARAE
jgi:hypothetical protein